MVGLTLYRRVRVARRLVALALLALAATAPLTARGDVAWSRLDTPAFTFFSNTDDETTRRYAAELETFRAFVARTLGHGAVVSPLPTQVYLFDSSEGFAEYSLGETNVGWFVNSRQANFIAIDTSSAVGTEVAYHEYVHFVVENSTPAIPLWLNEGLAEFYSNVRLAGETLEVGRPLERHVQFLRRNRPISFEELFAVTRDSQEYTEQRRRGVFYAQSWAFVHYLLVGQHEFNVEVDDFLDRLREGQETEEAYAGAFGTSTVGLRLDLEHYIGRAVFEFLRTPSKEPFAENIDAPRTLEEAEARARLGLLQLAGGRSDLDDLSRTFSRALNLDPTSATALRGLGELDLRRGDYSQASAWFAEALRHSPSDVANLDLHGLALMQRVQTGLTGAAALDKEQIGLVEQARHSFGQAIAREPTFAPALAGYGTTFFWDDDPGEGLEVSARAVRLLPRNPGILSTHLALVAQAGDVERARRVYDWLHRPAVRASPRNLADAELALFNAEFQYLIRSYDSPEHYPELLAGLESLYGKAPEPLLQVQLDGQIEHLRQVIERNYWADTYNGALSLLEGGDYRGATDLLKHIAAEGTDPEIVGQAEEALDHVIAVGGSE